MKFVDWVEEVLRALVAAFDEGNGMFTDVESTAGKLGLDAYDKPEGFWQALAELGRLGLTDGRSGQVIKVGHEALKIKVGSLRGSWPTLTEVWLDDRQEAFLSKLCQISERPGDVPYLEYIDGDDVLRAIGENPDRGGSVPLITQLADLGLVDKNRMTMGSFVVAPTYRGLVRAMEAVATEGQSRVTELLADWETTNVDFKRELHLANKGDKAEFVRDVLALANTQVTGNRYLVTGFDPQTHEFTTSADPSVTSDRIEDVLNEYTRPPVVVSYATFPWTTGTGAVGLVEIRRDRTKVPYRVAKTLSGDKRSIAEGGLCPAQLARNDRFRRGDRRPRS